LKGELGRIIGDSLFSIDECVDDFVFMCFLLGNDFLPSLPSMKIGKGGLDVILEIYADMFRCNRKYLTTSGYINLDVFTMLISKIAEREDDDLLKVYKVNTTKRPEPDPSDIKAILEDMGRVDDKFKDRVRMGTTGYRDRYYYTYFRISPTDKDFRKSNKVLCQNYVDGLNWTLKYYKKGCPNWDWHYRFHQAPLAADLLSILPDLNLNRTFPDSNPTTPIIQLMSVLPPESSHLVPVECAPLMTDPLSPLVNIFPTNYKLDYMGNRFMWQCHPILPYPGIKQIEEAVSSITLTKEEASRNVVGKNKLLKSEK